MTAAQRRPSAIHPTVAQIADPVGSAAELQDTALVDGQGHPEPGTADISDGVLLARVAAQIHDLHQQLTAAETLWATQIAQVDGSNRLSALNLVHYWAIRQGDLRKTSLLRPLSSWPPTSIAIPPHIGPFAPTRTIGRGELWKP